MEKTRLTLHQALIEALDSTNVYYNPPETLKMNFPAIVYKLDYIENLHADNKNYLDWTTYKVIVVCTKPDHPVVKKILNMEMTRFSTSYTRNGYYHYVIILKQKEKQS